MIKYILSVRAPFSRSTHSYTQKARNNFRPKIDKPNEPPEYGSVPREPITVLTESKNYMKNLPILSIQDH